MPPNIRISELGYSCLFGCVLDPKINNLNNIRFVSYRLVMKVNSEPIQATTDSRIAVQSGSAFGRRTDAEGEEGGVISSLDDDSSALPELDEDTLGLERD